MARLTLLGLTPQLSGPPGAPAALTPGKPLAALCLLALEPDGISREDLARCLWPGAAPERTRRSARQALYMLRKALGADAIVETDGHVTLARGAVETDLDDLQAALAAGDLDAAHARWRGGPFADFSLADAPAFNEWADRIRSRWEHRLGDALARRGAAEREAGRDEEALAWLGRVLDVRPDDEAAHALRVELLLEFGFVDEADIALERARSVVDDAASGRLDELAARLRRLRRAAPPHAGDEGAPTCPKLHFVGRRSEIAEIRSLWRSALAGRPRSVAILGPAGIGKTRLAEEWARSTVGSEATVARAKALVTERALPLGLAAEIAQDLASRPGAAGITNASLAVLRQLVPTLGKPSGPVPSGSLSEVAVADALHDLVEAVAGESPLVLWIEEMHCADALSRAVLLRLVRSLANVPVLTLVTCRWGDADPTAAAALRAEGEAGRFVALELAPLTPEEVAETLTRSLAFQPGSDARRASLRLAKACDGNPLFLRELLVRLGEGGWLTQDAGRWTLRGAGVTEDLPLPDSVEELLRARLEALRPELRAIVAALAHAEGSMTPDDLARRVGAPRQSARRAVEALVADRILVREMDAAGRDRCSFPDPSLHAIARGLFPPPGPARTTRRWLAGAGLAVGAIAVGTLLLEHGLERPEPPSPLYPGVIYASEEGAVRRFRPPTRRGGSWDSLPTMPLPRGVGAALLAPRRDLGVDAYTVGSSERGTPTVLRRSPEVAWAPLPGAGGGATPAGLSPDGRYLLLTVEGTPPVSFRQSLVRLDLVTLDTVLLYRAEDRVAGTWLADGSAVLARMRAEVDTLVLLRPDGVELAREIRAPGGYAGTPTPCGRSGRQLLEVTWEGETPVLSAREWGGAEGRRIWTLRDPIVSAFQCSPDGTAAASVVRIQGENRLLVVDLASGDTLLGPALPVFHALGWAPDGPQPVPTRVETHADSLLLGWGASYPVTATVLLGDGTRRADYPVEWTSLEPSVATVRDGTVFANGMGTAVVVASVQGWIADSLRIRVSGSSLSAQALLADAFETFDADAWMPFGKAVAEAVTTEEGPALELRGKDMREDGVASRKDFDLSRGATLEVSFRLPLTRRDRQGVAVCLSSGTPSSMGFTPRIRWTRETFCFSHPAGEGAGFDPSGFHFLGMSSYSNPHRSDLLPADTWVRASVVMSPDGDARLLLNQREVARLPWPVDNGPEHRWFVTLNGSAEDTRLLFKDFVLWEGVRY